MSAADVDVMAVETPQAQEADDDRAPGLALIGGGGLGSAMARGWRAAGLDADLLILEADAARRAALTADGFAALDALAHHQAVGLGAVVLAVKPHHIADVAAQIAYRLPPGVLLVSVAAGISILRLQALFSEARVVRAMPNTAAGVGRSITAYVAAEDVSDPQRLRAETLLSALGAVAQAPDEAAMHAVTAVSGSGPAYVYMLAEALAEAGEAAGLPAEFAARLARETIIGAGAMLEAQDVAPATLREQVTSPGGTTQAALAVLMGEAGADAGEPERAPPPTLHALMRAAVRAAAARSRALAEDPPHPADGAADD